jgi:hypothetical protein
MKTHQQPPLIGWAGRDVTPSGKVSLWGQHFVRVTDQVRDPLTATALALSSEDGREAVILVSLDACTSSDYVIDGCRRRLAAARPDVPPGSLLISGTHTHSGPDQVPQGALRPDLPDDVMTAKEYADLLVDRITDAAVEAWDSRAPGALAWGRSYAVVGFNRRTAYFDGSSRMYGRTDVPEFSHIEGHEDHAVELLFTFDAGHALTGVVVNVPCPSQCTESAYSVSADYWHETRQELRRRHGDGLHVLAQCSAAGDISPRTLLNRNADARMLRLKGYGNDYNEARRRDIADQLARAVDEVVPLVSTEIHDRLDFRHRTVSLDLPCRRVTRAELEEAERQLAAEAEKLAATENPDPTSREASRSLMLRAFHQRVIDAYREQQRGRLLRFPVELHVLRIGDIAMCTNRFEYYLDFGERIKGRSPALQTFIVQLTGQGKYLLTERSVRGGSYGASFASSPVGPEAGQQVVEATLAAVDELFGGATEKQEPC